MEIMIRKRTRKAISDEQITDYLVKKALKKANKIAKKLNTSSFTWEKKIRNDVRNGVSLDNVFTLKAEKKRLNDRMTELEKVRNRAADRAARNVAREEERLLLQRERARAEVDDYERKEIEFEFSQCKLRSKIRIQSGRAKPIDLLTSYIDEIDETGEFDFKGLNVKDEEEPSYMVFKGLNNVKELEELRDEIQLFLELDRQSLTHVLYWEALMVVLESEMGKNRANFHESIVSDVENLLQDDMSVNDLVSLQEDVELRMRSGEAKVVEFWEVLLNRVHIYKAKARLNEIHEELIKRRRGRPLDVDVDVDVDVVVPVAIRTEESEESRDGMEDGYGLRKPRYLTRVQTGYEWNKYNRTHYDWDNPPPKMVQGYKFTVFYPDLFDKRVTPVYFIEKDGDSRDTCIIRFHSGPPYEDVAFRIVNSEWECSRKRGFRCTFDKGVLQLHFNLKRYRYRK